MNAVGSNKMRWVLWGLWTPDVTPLQTKGCLPFLFFPLSPLSDNVVNLTQHSLLKWNQTLPPLKPLIGISVLSAPEAFHTSRRHLKILLQHNTSMSTYFKNQPSDNASPLYWLPKASLTLKPLWLVKERRVHQWEGQVTQPN